MGSTLLNQPLAQAYTSFTGTDIYLIFQDVTMATAQGLSYSITRQKAPIYTMGSADLRSVARSKRGIAGSMIFTVFDRHALADFMRASTFAAKKYSFENSSNNPMKAQWINNVGNSSPLSKTVVGSTIQTSPATNQTINGVEVGVSKLLDDIGGIGTVVNTGDVTTDLGNQIAVEETPMYSDQLLPFDVSLVASNEYGAAMVMRIFGIEILNEGSGVSVDDVSNEMQATYLARFISPWTPQKRITATI